MLRDIDHFYLQKEEPVKSCLIALREINLKQDQEIQLPGNTECPFFCYKGKMFC